MREKRKPFFLGIVLILVELKGTVVAWGYNSDSVLLKDIEVLTLYSGKMTTGGRSSPVPQLECVSGGTAPCNAFKPRVVQCYNRGYDGMDVQWECKSDMDNAYRFGEVEVSCEGFSHRDDPYVLRGSCGLRYSLDYTKEGLNQQRGHDYYGSDNSGHSYGGSSGYGNSYQTYKSDKLSLAGVISDVIVFVAAGLMIFAFYKTCCSGSSRHAGEDAYSSTSDDYPAGGGGGGGGGPGYGWFGGNNQHGNYPGGNYPDGASCRNRRANAGGGGGAGGFWTGAAAGGLLGYMFGNRGNQNYGNYGYGGYHQPRRTGGFFGGGGGGGWSTGGGGGGWSGGGGSSGTRTASGFGGTSRR